MTVGELIRELQRYDNSQTVVLAVRDQEADEFTVETDDDYVVLEA